MTDIALNFNEETRSVNRLGESLRQLAVAADLANASSLDKLRGAIAALGLGSREHLQQIAVDTRSILQKLQQEVKQTAVSNAKDITVSLAAEAAKQADIQATAIKSVVAEYKAAAASQKAIDKELHANRVASMQFEAAQRKMQIAESSAQAAIDASLHKNRVANLQFEAAQQLQLAKTAQQQVAAAMNNATGVYQRYNPKTGTAGAVVSPKDIEDTHALSSAVQALTGHNHLLNDSFRGLVQSLGMYSATMTAILPMLAGMAVGAAFRESLKVGSEFEQSMFVIREVAGTATADIKKVKEAVLEIGASTQYGPLEAAKGLEILTLAGLSTVDALQAIKPVLHFAATGGVTLEAAAETLVAVGTAYKYSAQNLEVVGDVIAKTASDTMASVTDMSAAFKQSTVVAQQYGMSLQDTAQAFGMLAQVGIRGTAAGTAYRNMLMEFNKGSGKAADGIKLLGVELKNADGSAKDLMTTMESLSKGLVTKDPKSQGRLLDDIANERGGKSVAAYQAAFTAELNKSNPLLQKEVDLLNQAGKSLEAKKVAEDAVAAAYARMREAAQKSADATGAYTFLVNLEEQFTTIGTYKGLLASLQTDFVKTFDTASDSTKLLGLSLRETLNTPEFTAAMSAMVNGVLNVADALAKLTAFTFDSPIAAVAGLTAAFLTAQVAIAALPAALTAVSAGVAAVGQSLGMMAALVAGAFEISAGAAILAVGGVAAAIAGVVAGLGYLIYAAADSRTAVEHAEAAKREEYLKTASIQAELSEKTINSQQGQLDAEVARVNVLNKVWARNRELTEQANAKDLQALTVAGGKTSEEGKRLHREAEELRSQRTTAAEAEAKAAGEAMQARITQWEETKLQIIEATRLQKLYNIESFMGGLQYDRGAASREANRDAEDAVKAAKASAEAARARSAAATASLIAAKQLQTSNAAMDAAASKLKVYGEGVSGYTGKPKFTPSPHVEKVKLETSNIVEELSKRNKLVMEADKASAANRKAVLDAEFAANLIDRSSYEAEVEHLRAKADAAAIAELTRQQEVRVAAYIAADEEIQNSQNKFNSLNAKNAKAIEDNDIHIAAVRANNANKYITDYLTTVNAISTIQQKANTDVRLVETKHQEALQKIKQEGLDWEASEIDLKAKNAKAATNASVVRRAVSPLQAAVLTAENSEFERLTANANKYDAEIKKLRESVIAYNEVQSVGTDLSSESADLDDRRSKANTKTIAQLTELIERKNKLAAGIPVELKIKGTDATNLFIDTETVRIRDGLTDAIMGAGKDGGAGLRNFLEAELLTKPFRMVVQATLEPIAQSLANSLWGGAGGGLASTGGVGGSIVNSMLGAVIGKGATMSSLGSAFGAGFSSTLAGNGLFSGASAGTAATGGAAGSGVAGAIGSAAPYIIAAAVAAGVLQRAQGSVTAAGTFVYGHNSATGFKTGGRADFIQEGGIGGGGTTPNSSWFDPGEATSKYMSAMADLVTTSVKGWAEAVGLSAEAVNGYTETVQAAIGNGMSKAEERQSIDKAMAGYGDAMIQSVFGELLAPLVGRGEAASATLQRLGTDLAGVNAILEKLGGGALEKSLAGAQVAEDFITAAGTLENLQAVSGQYYDSLYSAQEKALGATKDLDKAFADLGVTTPKSAAELRKLVESQDLSTAAGRSMAVSLMSLAPAFQQVAQSAVDARTAMLSDVGINSGDISGTIKKALIEGNLKTAGGEISEKIMTGIQDALYGRMADQITNSFTNEMLAPLLDAMQKGKSLPEALAAVDWTQVKSKFQQTVDDVAAIFNNTEVTSGIGSLKTAIQDLFSTASYSVPKGWVLTKTETTTQAATGGLITGPGTGTSDSIPAMLSNGEFVIKASSASKLGTGFLNALNAGKLPAQRANGGYVFDPLTGTRVIDAEFGYTPAYDDVRRSVPGMANFTDNEISWWQSNQTNLTAPASQTAGRDSAKTAEDLASTYETLATDAAQTYIDVLRAMGEVYSANVLALDKATEGFDELHVSMYREVEAGKQLVTLRETLVQAQRDYASSEVELLKAKGNGAGAAALQRSLDLADVSAKKTAAELRLLEAGLSENEKAYQSAIIATATATVAQYDLTKAREAEISAAGRLLSATKDVASSRIKLFQAGGSKGEADANQRAIDLADTFDSLNAASSRLATAGLSETERSVLLNTVAADLQTVAQYDLGKALETTTEHVTAAVSGLKNLQDSFETLNVSALTALGDKAGAGAAQKAIDLKSVNEAASTAQTLLNSGAVTDADVKAGLELTVNTAKLADAQYDLNEAITAGIAGLTGVKGVLEGFQKTGDDLVIQRTRLTGNDAGADVLQRSSDLKDVFKGIAEATATLESDGITPLQRSIAEATVTTGKAAVAQYDRNKSLTDEIEILGRYKSAQAEANSTNIELLKVTGQTAKAAGLELASATKGFNDTQIATVRQTNATKGLIAAYGNLSNTENMVTNSRIGLLKAKGDTAGAATLQRELDIAPYVKAISESTIELARATTEAEKDTLRLTIAKNNEAIVNSDLSKSLDKEAEAANDAKTAADNLASSYADLKKQIEDANIELLRASGKTQEAEDAATALALRDHAGDAYYESLYRELLTIQKLTAARQKLTDIEADSVQNQIELIRANGGNMLADALERSAFLASATAPAAAAKAELDRSNVSWSDFLATKGVAIGTAKAGGAAEMAANLASGTMSASAFQSLTTLGASGAGGSNLPEDVRKLLYEFGLNQRTESQKANLQGVVDTAQSIAAAYDRNKALEAELKIIELQDEAYKQSLDAQKAVADAQKQYADVLKSTIETMRDFIATLDGGASPLQNLSTARQNFQVVANRAATGDTSAYKDLTPAARAFLDLSKSYSRSIQDYQRDEARVRATLNAVIKVNQSELDKLPKEIAEAADPTKQAWTKLQEALNKEANASIAMESLSVDAESSKRRLRTAEETLAERYLESVYNLDEVKREPLLKTYQDALKKKVDETTLPDYSQVFSLGDIWGTKIESVLPRRAMTNMELNKLVAETFPGLKVSDLLTDPASVSKLVDTKLGEILPANFAGQSFDTRLMMQAAIDKITATFTAQIPAQPTLPSNPAVTEPPYDPGLAAVGTGTGTLQTVFDASSNVLNFDWAALTAEQTRAALSLGSIDQIHMLGYLAAIYDNPSYDKNDKFPQRLKNYLHYKGYPGFAQGTNNVPRDMLAQIHKGEVIIPEPFNPERYSKASGNTALVQEIQALRKEVSKLRDEQRAGNNAIAANTRKTAQALTKFDTDGMPETRT